MKNQFVPSALLTVLALLLVNGITSYAMGATVYQDNFDNVAVGIGFTPPSPQVGTRVGGSAVVRTGAVPAHSSPNYLENNRNNDQQPVIAGMRGDLAGDPVGLGTLVHAEQWLYHISGHPAFGINVDANNPHPWDVATGDGVIIVAAYPDGDVRAISPTGSLVSTGMTHQVNVWELWQIDYTVGASSYTLTIGANSMNLDATLMKNPAATQVGGVFIQTFSGASHGLVDDLLVEAIPEPAGLSLLGLGGLALLGRRVRFNL